MELITLSLSLVFFVCLVVFLYLKILYVQKQVYIGISATFFVISLCMLTAEIYPNMKVVYDLYFANRLGGDPVFTLLKNFAYQLGLVVFVQIINIIISILFTNLVLFDEFNTKLQRVLTAGGLSIGLTYLIKQPVFDFAMTLIDTGMVSGFN